MGAQEAFESDQTFRLDVPLHTLLTQPTAPPPGLRPAGEPQTFPAPVFPQHPEFSTLNHILGWCYNDQRVIKYFFKQLAHGFQGMKGQM